MSCAQARNAASKADAAAGGSAAQQADGGQAVGSSSAARGAAKQEAGGSDEQSRGEAARRQRARDQAAQQQAAASQQQQPRSEVGQNSRLAVNLNKTGQSDMHQAAQQASGGASEGNSVGDGAAQAGRTAEKGGIADRRLQDPVADPSAAGSKAEAAGVQSGTVADAMGDAADVHVGQSGAADASVLPAAEIAAFGKKQTRQPQHSGGKTDSATARKHDVRGGVDSDQAGAQQQTDKQQRSAQPNQGREELIEDLEFLKEAADQDKYEDADAE